MRRVPWSRWEEWHLVRTLLLAHDPSQQRKGLEWVSAWRSRGRIPLAVDSTADLIEGRLADSYESPPASGVSATIRSEREMRLLYSSILVRFVNGFTDQAQMGVSAAPVSFLAREVGLPEWLVEIRHTATHGRLSSLCVLRSAASDALEWLMKYYWEAQAAHLQHLQGEVVSLLRLYRHRTLKRMAKLGTSKEAATRHEAARALRAIVMAMEEDGVLDAVVPILWDGDFLIPTAHVHASLCTLSFAKRLLALWGPVLAYLDSQATVFLVSGAERLAKGGSDERRLSFLSAWLVLLLGKHSPFGSSVSQETMRRIVAILLRHPTRWCIQPLRRALSMVTLPPDVLGRLRRALSLYHGLGLSLSARQDHATNTNDDESDEEEEEEGDDGELTIYGAGGKEMPLWDRSPDLTLEEAEAFLQSHPHRACHTTLWQLCSVWEPCAVGIPPSSSSVPCLDLPNDHGYPLQQPILHSPAPSFVEEQEKEEEKEKEETEEREDSKTIDHENGRWRIHEEEVEALREEVLHHLH